MEKGEVLFSTGFGNRPTSSATTEDETMMMALDFDAAPGAVPASAVSSRIASTPVAQTKPQKYKAPAELGIYGATVAAPKQPSPPKAKILNKERSSGHIRTRQAIQSMKSPAAAAAAAQAHHGEVNPSRVCTVAYKGMELILATERNNVVCVCARTRVTLQYLELPNDSCEIIHLSAHPVTGLVVVACSNGLIQTYHPVATVSKPSPESTLVSAFGRHRWLLGATVDTKPVFDVAEVPLLHVSLSQSHKLLVGFEKQLAIFDVRPDEFLVPGELLWTTWLDSAIETACLSGDGHAIVYTVDGEAKTMVRDWEDGAKQAEGSRPTLQRSTSTSSIGIVYQAGPVLGRNIVSLSFRGSGTNTSSVTEQEEGNDLLLVVSEDNVISVFAQNGWKRLIHWTAPPDTLVEWVRGLSAFTLGDLEAHYSVGSKRAKTSRRPSLGTDESSVTAAFQAAAQQTAVSHPSPSTSAGAWIAEITFRSAFPALRLSRLSYMKRGNEEAQPAHFESVSAILPAGSILAQGMIRDGTGLSVQGIWPAWHPWASSGAVSSSGETETLRGSAMAFLGLSQSTNVVANNGFFGDHSLGGTHSPPSELRLVASHPRNGHIVLMEFPLWGDMDFGAMELGSPLRFLLSLSEIERTACEKHAVACLNYESNILCAQLESDCRSIAVTWRMQGTQSILPGPYHTPPLLPSYSGEENELSPIEMENDTNVYCDISVIPVPLALPSLRLPPSVNNQDERFVAIKWWPCDTYGGPPQLLGVCSSGSLFLYEMPPPWSALEPVMPSYDPLTGSANVSLSGSEADPEDDVDNESTGGAAERREYEVNITPHPEFGIGLRLEAQMDGMPAVAGSYKKHPLNGGRLPAEKTGMIMLGDELLSVNGVSLEGITFDEIIATVRQIGADTVPGTPMCMRFRPVMANRVRAEGSAFSESSSAEQSSSIRRTREQIFGLTPKQMQSRSSDVVLPEPNVPPRQATVVGTAIGEMQQEFARIIASVQGIIPAFQELETADHLIELMDWAYGVGTPSSELRGAALLLVADGKSLYAKRLEVAVDCNPKKARCLNLGCFDLPHERIIVSIQSVHTGTNRWCLNVCDDIGCNGLLFVEIEEAKGDEQDAPVLALKALFQYYPAIARTSCQPKLRSYSSQLFATMPETKTSQVSVWSCLSGPKQRSCNDRDEDGEHEKNMYFESILKLGDDIHKDDEIVDVRFLSTGSLDAYPWIIIFTRIATVVYIRAAGEKCWSPKLTLRYPLMPTSSEDGSRIPLCDTALLSPADFFPHIIQTIRMLVETCDESRFIRSDWHPDALLTYVCTDSQGPLDGFRRNVHGVFTWLSKWTHPTRSDYPVFNHDSPLGITPIKHLRGKNWLGPYSGQDLDGWKDESAEKASNLMAVMATTTTEGDEDQACLALKALQSVLCLSNTVKDGSQQPTRELGGDFRAQGEYLLPPPLRKLNRDEIRLLWALGEMLQSPPKHKNLDACAQHAFFCISLLKQLKAAQNDGEEEDTDRPSNSNEIGNAYRSHFTRLSTSSLNANSKEKRVAISAAGVIAALTSNTQTALLGKSRPDNDKFDWNTACSYRLPFWVRSDDEMRRISEEIGLAIYRKTRDVMESALFFIVAGNLKTLKNLAATDQQDSGRKFFKFLTSYDFSDPRGRKAAEKNAYSLLRKNRYVVAASFFLLPQPPMLKTAVETIVTKTGDLDLAFLITRLAEASEKSSANSLLGGMALGSMGGGGGFAGTGIYVDTNATCDKETYGEWAPKLGQASKHLLRDRGFEIAGKDRCLRAILLLWLGRSEEAASELAQVDEADADDLSFPQSFDIATKMSTNETTTQMSAFQFKLSAENKRESANERVSAKANKVIDFVSQPFLLKAMKCSSRSRWASSIVICRSLMRRGIELASVRYLIQIADPLELGRGASEKGDAATNDASVSTGAAKDRESLHPREQPPQFSEQTASSIFDSFDVAPVKPRGQGAVTDRLTSSIFDSFDVARPKPAHKQDVIGTTQVVSSIFDSFEVPRPPEKRPTEPLKTEAASSIFDGFDTAPQVPRASVSLHDEMNSSIFASFEAPKADQENPALATTNSTPLGTNMSANRASYPGALEEESNEAPEPPSLPTPLIWLEWRNNILIEAAARRLIREIGHHIDRIHGDLMTPPLGVFSKRNFNLVSPSAAEILRTPCDGVVLLDNLLCCLEDVCGSCQLEPQVIVEQALWILNAHSSPKRIVFAVILHTVDDRADLAEDVIRDAALAQIHRCGAFTLSHDDLVDHRKTTHHCSSQHLRRHAAHVSWQLELCLWLHRGGLFPLSGVVLREAIVAVRVGFILACWGRNHECLDLMARNEPDCPLDRIGGRQLWTSLKMIAGMNERTKKVSSQGSGGWEFLVDCKREHATAMLRARPPGSFIIRPHQQDNGVFTLSFKTNLTPAEDRGDATTEQVPDEDSGEEDKRHPAPTTKPVKKDDVVQHAIIRLSDAGFRCGSFGPFTSLMKLLEAVSASLPFDLLFDKPPNEGIIKEEEHQPSPNAVFLRKFALSSMSDNLNWSGMNNLTKSLEDLSVLKTSRSVDLDDDEDDELSQLRRFGTFSQLLTLSEIRTQLSAVASAEYEGLMEVQSSWMNNDEEKFETDSVESIASALDGLGVEERYAMASRLVRPFLIWCRCMETLTIHVISPGLKEVSREPHPCALAFTESAIELAPHERSSVLDGGDAMIRRMIQPESGVEFRTLRVGEGGESAMIVLFSKSEALSWVKASGMEKSDKDSFTRLQRMEKRRVIEPIALSDLNLKAFSQHLSSENVDDITCYRFVDPWEVEALENREGETKAAALGREHYLAFSVNAVASSCEGILRKLGGLHLLGLWANQKGGLRLTKAIASVHAPWERDTGGDMMMSQGVSVEPTPFQNSVRQHLYRNAIFRRSEMPQRFLALVQVELLDLKNLNAPGGASLSVFALLRLKRSGSSAPLTHKARTLDSAATHPIKIGKSSGPNAPASWGSLVRFRFPLPEDVNCDGISFDRDRESLFKGPPSVLQLSVYEKKFMSDILLGGADVKLDALTSGGQMEEWVPLRSQKHGINWFARIRLTLRFELMCLPSGEEDELPASVGLSRIQQLSRMGGAHEDKIKRSSSTPDILSYFESMVY